MWIKTVTGKAHLQLFASALLWGATWPAGRWVAHYLPPIASASVRFALAAALLLLMVYLPHRQWTRLPRRLWPALFFSGLVGVFGYAVFFMWGLSLIPASRGALIITLNPAVTVLAASVFLGERLRFRTLFSIALTIAGAITVITHGHWGALTDSGMGRGEWMIVGCVLCWVAYSINNQFLMRHIDSFGATAYSIAIGAALLLLFAPYLDIYIPAPSGVAQDWRTAPDSVYAALLFLTIGATVMAYSYFFAGVKALGSSIASAHTGFVPVFGVAFSCWWLGEAYDWSLLLGTTLTLGGVLLMNLHEFLPQYRNPVRLE